MSRKQRTHPEIRKEIAGRFVHAYEIGMGCTPAEISRRLGYANQTTIQSIKRGKTLPDFARICLYRNELRDKRGGFLNLHWLITGEGAPFIKSASAAGRQTPPLDQDDDIFILWSTMSAKQRSALTRFLAELG